MEHNSQTASEMVATLLKELEAEKAAIAKLQAELAASESRQDAILQVIEGLQRLFPTVLQPGPVGLPPAPVPPKRQKDAPRGREAVMAILKDTDQWMTAEEIVSVMTDRGWRPDSEDPQGAVRTTLGRVLNDNLVTRQRRDGRTYEYRARFDPYALEDEEEERRQMSINLGADADAHFHATATPDEMRGRYGD